VLVATLNGLKMHGGTDLSKIKEPDEEGVRKGFANLDKHIRNIRSFGQTVVVCFNKYASDTDAEINMVKEHCQELGVPFALNNAFAEGGEGAIDLANLVVDTIESNPSGELRFTYDNCLCIKGKIESVVKNIYGAANVNFSAAASRKIAAAEKMGLCNFPVCIAKTQYSFSQDPNAYGAPEGFDFEIQDIVINTGSEMIVAIAGSIIRMPGLPKYPQAQRIDIVEGEIEGLS
jgi:formate--tetrahydrofolate ligase